MFDPLMSPIGVIAAVVILGVTFGFVMRWLHRPRYDGCTLEIIAGTGKGQKRTIVEWDEETLTLAEPWDPAPDETSVYAMRV